MKRFLTGLLFVFAGLAAPAVVLAQDIFVRPSTSGAPAAPMVDYGVKAKPQAAPPVTAVPPVTQPPITQPPVAAPQHTPVLQVQPQQSSPAAQANASVAEASGKDANIIHIPEDPPPETGQGSNTLSLNYSPGLIGVSDKTNVMRSLGYSEKDVQDNCFFSYGVIVGYGNNQGAFLKTGTAVSAHYRFVPPLVHIGILPTIACRRLHPPASGLIVEQGGYYVTTLATVDCNPSNGGTGNPTLNFTYTGDGTGQCHFQ